jgi:hypothetical protein
MITPPLPSIRVPASSVKAGNEDVRVIVVGDAGGNTAGSKIIVSEPTATFAAIIASRSDPGPVSLVLVTTYVAAKAGLLDVCRIRMLRNNTNDNKITLFRFIVLSPLIWYGRSVFGTVLITNIQTDFKCNIYK